MAEELTQDRVYRRCDPNVFEFKTTVEIGPLTGIVGQERATRALEFGLEMRHPGFNIFVSGAPGTGKFHAVQHYLHARAEVEPTPSDWCYVNNFRDSYRPRCLKLPAGRGKTLQRAVEQLIRHARQELVEAFESEEYTKRRQEITQAVQAAQGELIEKLNQQARPMGFVVRSTPVGISILPLANGNLLTEQEFLNLSQEQREGLQQSREKLEQEVNSILRKAHDIQHQAEERLETLNREIIRQKVRGLFDAQEEQFRDCPEVVEFLNAAEQDLIANVRQLLAQAAAQEGNNPQASGALQEAAMRRYSVNLLVDNSDTKGAPVVVGQNPTVSNLVGRLEREALFGVFQTDFTLIKGGALHRANGGYLVLNVEDVLRNFGSYDSLKRSLRDSCLTIEDFPDRMGMASTKSLQPDPIPLDVTVVLLGNPSLYFQLFALDPEFREVFKVKAEFGERMDRTPKNVQAYGEFVSGQCQREALKTFDASGVAKIVELGSRLADDQEALSTRFSEIVDVLREASYWATRASAPAVTAHHVKRAIEARVYRSNLIEERLRDLTARGVIRVDTRGAQVGQVNGLSVLSLGDYSFGRPARITASVGLGQAGLVDIEREAKLGGPTHTKGVLILGGYLTERYAQNKPLALSARLVFEQSYEGVEGDSASSAELYALLSALSGVPLKQGIAVTGSVDQRGRVQAIGGINQKIEGFFDVCRIKGLTGEQGVLIPKSNERNLTLREDVGEAIGRGDFHVWTVETIDEGVEVLTGVPAGRENSEGRFPEGTVNGRVDKRLADLAKQLKAFRRGDAASSAQQGNDK
ncbi:MAG: ATP-dependent protease [Dehalococcoidia bacterium]|nr:ATP-dependent protease [Dehalococcoidia bacterium]